MAFYSGHTHIMGFSGERTVLGLGHDLVSIADFAERLAMPGTRMSRLFSVREQRQSQWRAWVKGDDPESHLAVRWAGKEAVLKAWSEALEERDAPYGLDDFPWGAIEILDDSRGRPGVYMAQDLQLVLSDSLGADGIDRLAWHISLTHDAGLAAAVVILERFLS